MAEVVEEEAAKLMKKETLPTEETIVLTADLQEKLNEEVMLKLETMDAEEG